MPSLCCFATQEGVQTSPGKIYLSPKILCRFKLLDLISFLWTQARGLHGAIFQAAKSAVPVQEGQGVGKENMNPVLPGYPQMMGWS